MKRGASLKARLSLTVPGAGSFVPADGSGARRMMESTRRRRVEELLIQYGECSVNRLAQELKVSEMTIRRDLQALAGADGIDLEGNIYNASIEVCRMLTRMVASAKAAYVVCDASKIGRAALMRFGKLSDCRGLITDDSITPQRLKALQKARVTVLLADDHPEPAASHHP